MSLAVDEYEKVLQIDATDVHALYDLGDVHQLEGNDPVAEVQHKAAPTSDPRLVSALFNLAILKAKSVSTQAEAAKLYRDVMKLVPDTPAYRNLGAILQNEGHIGQALVQHRKAHQLDSALPIPQDLTAGSTTTTPARSSGAAHTTTT